MGLNSGYQRGKQDPGEAGFWLGRQFGVSWEFDITTLTVMRFIIPVPGLLFAGGPHIDKGHLRYRVFTWPDDSRESGAFDTPIPVAPLNTLPQIDVYEGQIEAATGGAFDTTGLNPYPTARIRVSSETSGRETGAFRGFGVGRAYILLEPIEGVRTTGVVDLRFEERDRGY